MHFDRLSNEYRNGVDDFLDKAFARSAEGDKIFCLCKKCYCLYWYKGNVVYEHLIVKGLMPGYNTWIFHGECLASNEVINANEIEVEEEHDDIDGLLNDTFLDVREQDSGDNIREGPNAHGKKFYKLVEEGQQELYTNCKNFSRLSFTIRLYLLKCLHSLSNDAFGDILTLIKEAFPEVKAPSSFNEARNMVQNLGLHYKKIHICFNDRILFWDEYEKAEVCHVCGASRWIIMKDPKGDDAFASTITRYHQVPAKILRYFPLKSRLQRLSMCPETANDMAWHVKHRPNDDDIRQLADGQAWKDFDSLHPDFAKTRVM